jgi:glycosyltransferase involved in cell wall biosynthesis
MKVIIFNDYASIHGGVDQTAITGAWGLAERGHDVTFVYAVDKPVLKKLEESGARLVRVSGIDAVNSKSRIQAFFSGLWNFKAVGDIRELLAAYDPAETIIHVHGWSKALSPSVFYAIRKAGFSPIATFNDYIAACPNGAFFEYPRNQVCQRKPLSMACVRCHCDRRSYGQKIWRVIRQLLLHRVARFPSTVQYAIVVSRFSEAILAKHLPPSIELFLLPNPIDVKQAPPVDPGKNETYSFVGRLAAEKGPDFMASAGAQTRVPMRFIGSGELAGKVAEIYPQAEITGWQARADVARFLSQSRALIFPSLWYEAQPLGVVEASALGIPTLVSDACAAKDSVQDGITGLHFRSGDLADLTRAIKTLSDPEVARRMGRAAYDAYWNHAASPDLHAAQLESIYFEIKARIGRLESAVNG